MSDETEVTILLFQFPLRNHCVTKITNKDLRIKPLELLTRD